MVTKEKRECEDCGDSFMVPVQAPFNHCPDCYEEEEESTRFEGEVDDGTKLRRVARRRRRYNRSRPRR